MMPLARQVMVASRRAGGREADDRIRRAMKATIPDAQDAEALCGSRMLSAAARVLGNERIRGGCHRIVAAVKGGWPDTGPGQFAMLSLDHPRFPILPRPFSRWQRGADTRRARVRYARDRHRLFCSLRPGGALNVVGSAAASTADCRRRSSASPAAADARSCSCSTPGTGPPTARGAQHEGPGARTAERHRSRAPARCQRSRAVTDDGTRGFHGRGRPPGRLLAERPPRWC
jgi:hypothetical protein